MKVMTIQLAKWRKVTPPMVLVDASIKSGNPTLAPTWGLLTEYKCGLVGEDEYEQRFKSIIKMRWNTSDEFKQLINSMAVKEEVQVIGCYCAAGTFCHRHLLVEFLNHYCVKNQLPFEYLGELE